MKGNGFARFAKRLAPAEAATAPTTTTNAPPPHGATPSGDTMGGAAAAAANGLDESEFYGGVHGYGMDAFDGSYGHFEFQPQMNSDEKPAAIEDGENQKSGQAAEPDAMVAPAPDVAAAAPPFPKPAFVLKSGAATGGRPTNSRPWLAATTGASQPWLSPTPYAGPGVSSQQERPRSVAAGNSRANAPQPDTGLPRRSGILFAPRKMNQATAQVATAPPAPRPLDNEGPESWRPSTHAKESTNVGLGSTVPTPPDNRPSSTSAPVSILKTPRFQGQGSEGSTPVGPENQVVTPPTPAPGSGGSIPGRSALYETPVPPEQRRVIPTGTPASTPAPATAVTAAAITPSTGSSGKKSVSFDPDNLTEVFVIPRALAEVDPNALATSPTPEREPDRFEPMQVDDRKDPPAKGDEFDFDAADHVFSMNCRESIDRVKVMTDDILDLNEYLAIMQADTHVMQANLVDVAMDADGLCRGYEGILKLLESEFPTDE